MIDAIPYLSRVLPRAAICATLLCAVTPGISFADGDCRNLDTYISNAKKNVYYMQVSRFTTEHPDGMSFNLAVDEVDRYLDSIKTETGEKRAACAVIALSRARKISKYARDDNYNLKYSSELEKNIDEVKKCLVSKPPPLETEQQIYKYESDAYYTCNSVLKP